MTESVIRGDHYGQSNILWHDRGGEEGSEEGCQEARQESCQEDSQEDGKTEVSASVLLM
jgi:hypothetical protein